MSKSQTLASSLLHNNTRNVNAMSENIIIRRVLVCSDIRTMQCHRELNCCDKRETLSMSLQPVIYCFRNCPGHIHTIRNAAIVSHKNTWGGRVPPVSSDSGWYSGKLKSQWADHWPVSHTPVTLPRHQEQWPGPGLLTLNWLELHKGADMKKAKQQCKVPFRNSYHCSL